MKMRIERNEKVIKKVINDETLNKSTKMKELFKNGLDVKEISEIMNVRYNFVYNVISNEILKGNINEEDIIKVKNESKKDIILKLHRDGKSKIEICKELKICYNMVWSVLNKNK
jgi:RIO-like serine/threonine protein kinase